MLADGMIQRGHDVEVWQPKPKFFNWSKIGSLKKWLGYIDQFVVFPSEVNKKLKNYGNDTVFVFTDHALGPWVPLVNNRAHVVHCHDFLAQLSALNHIPENPTGFTGRIYQKYIRGGYTKGKNFISVSEKTNELLQQFLPAKPALSEVVYNGLNQSFNLIDKAEARATLSILTGLNLNNGFIMHIGGNQWYKNRAGVIAIYDAWRSVSDKNLPLVLVGKAPNAELNSKKAASAYANDIYLLTAVTDEQLQLAYSGATMLLFPSLAEGFGWPIAEAMASGCPVITTNHAPMTEVAADAAFYIDRKPEVAEEESAWAKESAKVVEHVASLTAAELTDVINAGLKNAERFDTEVSLNKIESIYKKISANVA
ncbi:hypothetical protein GCM10023149_13870 [Mucilaginibacter gynuensis]|uniref:Glycosyltransferase subfamily 4-like N-terminal domain-containing protein n=2 Tax=Mucilaginibacter gynuensis TaxID=1302236 RepID=A0ABP8G3Q7_9SPHI